MPLWATPPNPAVTLAKMLRKIIKFHESEPLLMQAPSDKFQFHTENGQKWTDSSAMNAPPRHDQPTPGETGSNAKTSFHTENGQKRTDSSAMNAPPRNDQPAGGTPFPGRSPLTPFPPCSNSVPKPDWKAQAELFRLEEWALYMEIMRAADSVIQDMRNHPRRVSLSQLANIFLLASKLGRRACGLPIDGSAPPSPPGPPPIDHAFEEALKRAYPDPEPENTQAGCAGQNHDYNI